MSPNPNGNPLPSGNGRFKIKSKILFPHIYILTYPNQYELCMSFVRMQEFYESPKFKGKYFTLEEYIDYWSLNNGNGAFTYPIVWNGFNLPGNVFENWRCKFSDVRPRESIILSKIDDLIGKDKRGDKYYIIAVNGSDKIESMNAIEHETAHAFYYLYPEYKRSCKKLLKSISKNKYKKDKEKLLKMGYCKKVINDELQAYYSVDSGLLGFSQGFIDNFTEFKNSLK